MRTAALLLVLTTIAAPAIAQDDPDQAVAGASVAEGWSIRTDRGRGEENVSLQVDDGVLDLTLGPRVILYRETDQGSGEYTVSATFTQLAANRHYEAHVGKPFFPGLVQFITSSPVVALAIQGGNSIEVVRRTMGATDPKAAGSGTVRGDLGVDIGRNLVHGSDSPEAAEREITLFFNPGDLVEWSRSLEEWITE